MDRVKGFFGIDIGEFELRLDQSSYRLGETIHGTFEFVLTKPRKVNQVWVKVQALRKVQNQERDAQGHLHTTTDEQVVYSEGLTLDGQREYTEGRYPFDFPLPSYIQGYDPPGMQAAIESLGGVYRDLAEGAWSLLKRSPRSDQIEWTVSAGVSFPWGVSPTRSVRIGMGRAAHRPAAEPAGAAGPVCPSCGRVSPRSKARFCTACGSAMSEVLRCRCGEKLEPHDRFCTRCGASTGKG